jgi:hypothetical protein
VVHSDEDLYSSAVCFVVLNVEIWLRPINTNRRAPSCKRPLKGCFESRAREDFPTPELPVMTTSLGGMAAGLINPSALGGF